MLPADGRSIPIGARAPARTKYYRIVRVPQTLHLQRMEDADHFEAELVVEMAPPSYTEQWGERILARSDYLPLVGDGARRRAARSAHSPSR